MEKEEVKVREISSSLRLPTEHVYSCYRGQISAGLCQALLQIKIRQRIKTTTTHTEIIGKKVLKRNLNKHFTFSEFSLGSLETVQVGLLGLGPFNCLARKVIKDLVMQNIRND